MELEDIYGSKLNTWQDSSFEEGSKELFTFSTEKGTVMYGKDLENGGFFSAFTTEKYYMEFAPEETFPHKTMKTAKTNATKLLNNLNQ